MERERDGDWYGSMDSWSCGPGFTSLEKAIHLLHEREISSIYVSSYRGFASSLMAHKKISKAINDSLGLF